MSLVERVQFSPYSRESTVVSLVERVQCVDVPYSTGDVVVFCCRQKHFTTIGSPLKCINVYPTPQTQEERYLRMVCGPRLCVVVDVL